jgi:hypothetical protein
MINLRIFLSDHGHIRIAVVFLRTYIGKSILVGKFHIGMITKHHIEP